MEETGTMTALASAMAPVRERTGRHAKEGRFLAITVILLVVLQRFAVSPGGNEVPILIPVLLVLVIIGVLTGNLKMQPLNAALLTMMIVSALICTLAVMSRGTLPSLLSIGLMALIYIPAMFRSTGGSETVERVARAFVALMTIAAVVSLEQFLGQYVGLQNVDWFTQIFPSQFLVHGFSPNALISYGHTLRRSNAYVFLEPSFLSLSLGMAVLVAVRAGCGWIRLTILLAGMLPTLAGNGLVVLIPGLIVTLFSPVRRNLMAIMPGLITAIVVALVSPLGTSYLGRTTEANSAGSSSSLRFVQPYSALLPPSLDTPFHALFGHGASSSNPFLDNQGLMDITRPILPKVLFEYGVMGVIGIVLVLIIVFVMGLRHAVWMVGLLPTYFIVNAAFLQAELAAFTFFWLLMLPREPGIDSFRQTAWRHARKDAPPQRAALGQGTFV